MTLPQAAGAGNTNNTTVVDIVAAPAASTTRQVTHINVFNADTATATVTIQKDVSGTNYVLISYSVVSGDTLMWSREDGWRLMSAASGGAITLLGDVTGTGIGSVTTTIANDAVTYAKIQNVSAASKLLGRGSAGGAGDVEEITLGTGLTMTGTTLDATGGGGGISAIGTIDSQTKSANGAVISGTDLVMQTADATNPGLVSTSAQTFKGDKTVDGRLNVLQDTTVTTEVCSVIAATTTNANLVIAPNGTGAIIADIPDGASTGGNARGNNAVDLQTSRATATNVASGNFSKLAGGQDNTASGSHSVVAGGQSNASSGAWSACNGGYLNTVSADLSSCSGGFRALGYLYGQRVNACGYFASNSDAQTSSITLRRSITGTAITELSIDGGTPTGSNRFILSIASPGPTNARAWRAQIDVVAICATVGNGTTVLNDVFAGSYHAAIKRVGTNTSLVGTVSVTNEVSDASMSTSVVTIDADDTNEALRIQFTPPTTAGSTTVVRVVATAYLTDVGR
jgi:hypothetical protein